MFTLLSASNPTYASQDQQSINLTVQWAEFSEPFSFTASANDIEPHGLELYTLAKEGKFGVIGDYIPLATEELTAIIKEQAKYLLAQSDWSVLPDVGLKNSADFITYRRILRGLVIQPQVNPDFPLEPTPVWE